MSIIQNHATATGSQPSSSSTLERKKTTSTRGSDAKVNQKLAKARGATTSTLPEELERVNRNRLLVRDAVL